MPTQTPAALRDRQTRCSPALAKRLAPLASNQRPRDYEKTRLSDPRLPSHLTRSIHYAASKAKYESRKVPQLGDQFPLDSLD